MNEGRLDIGGDFSPTFGAIDKVVNFSLDTADKIMAQKEAAADKNFDKIGQGLRDGSSKIVNDSKITGNYGPCVICLHGMKTYVFIGKDRKWRKNSYPRGMRAADANALVANIVILLTNLGYNGQTPNAANPSVYTESKQRYHNKQMYQYATNKANKPVGRGGQAMAASKAYQRSVHNTAPAATPVQQQPVNNTTPAATPAPINPDIEKSREALIKNDNRLKSLLDPNTYVGQGYPNGNSINESRLDKIINKNLNEALGTFGNAIKNGWLESNFSVERAEIDKYNGMPCLRCMANRWLSTDDKIILLPNGTGIDVSDDSDKSKQVTFRWHSVRVKETTLAKSILVGAGIGAAVGAVAPAAVKSIGSAGASDAALVGAGTTAGNGSNSNAGNGSNSNNDGTSTRKHDLDATDELAGMSQLHEVANFVIGGAVGATAGAVGGGIYYLYKNRNNIIYYSDGSFHSIKGNINGRWDMGDIPNQQNGRTANIKESDLKRIISEEIEDIFSKMIEKK